ncbi:MAG: AAA family ATP:ADP antiporter [Enterobacterales bacterium]|jgi:AAA family ATP:ADP antiporter
MTNPFKTIIDIHKGERVFAFLMASYFFFVITTFWILKPLKKAAFLSYYNESGFSLFGLQFSAADAELWAKVANMIVAMVAVTIFTMLSKRFIRQQLTIIFSAFFILCFFMFSLAISKVNGSIAWNFYLMGDLYSTLMVATFFIFLNDSVTSQTAKRLYGLVGLGGVLGGAFGSITVNALVKSASVTTSVWMWICIGITIIIAILAILSAKYAPIDTKHHFVTTDKVTDDKSSNPVLEGAKLVFNSKYLFSIVSIIGLYEVSSTLIDYQFTRTVLHYVDTSELGAAFGTAYVYMNVTAVIVQLFLTSFIMKKFGVKTALFILPFAILIVSAGFMITPILALAMLMPSIDGGLAYSLNQSAKEVLYVPTSKDEKYKAKAFIDMFVQRFAKVIAIGVTLIITSYFQDFESVRWLSIGTFITIFLWLIAVRYAGNEFHKKEIGRN